MTLTIAAAAPAAPPTPTQLLLAQVPVTYPGMQATITGKLTVQSQVPADRTPVPGKQITLSYQACNTSATVPLGTATTGTDGTFSLTAKLLYAGLITASFAGDSRYARAVNTENDDPVQLPTRVTLNPLPATIAGNSELNVTGTVQVQQPGGTWIPAPTTFVRVHGATYNDTATAFTNSAGNFTSLLYIEDAGPFVTMSLPNGCSFAAKTTSPPQPAHITPAPVRITGFAPATTPQIAQTGLTFTATAQALWTSLDGTTQWADAPYLQGQLWFRRDGATTWTLISAQYVDAAAGFTDIPGYLPDGQPAEGSWQIRTTGTPIFRAGASAIITVPVKVRTWLNNTRITTAGRHHHLTGVLDDQHASGPLPAQRIRLYYRIPGSRTWHYSATVRTGTRGGYTSLLPAARRWYKAVYTASGYYLPVTSPAVYNPS